jgi:predicted dehydrogenase
MKKHNNLGFGLIGAGMISSFHARSITELEGARLVAISSRGRVRGEKLANDFNVPFYPVYHEMLKRSDIDVVNICTPSGMHMEPTLAAAAAGKHVMVEKPVEITLERADRMIEACDKAGVKLAVIFQNRFNRGASLLREAVNNGVLGRLVLGDAYVKWYRDQEYYNSVDWRGTLEGDGGAALINQSIHTIDLLQWIMGPVESIFGRIGTFTHTIEGEDTGLAILTFKNGALGVIEGSTSIYPGFPERLEIHGEKGTIILEGGSVKTWEIEGAGKKPADLVDEPKAVGASSPMAIPIDAHKAQIADMLDAVRSNRDPLVDGREAKKSLQIVRSIYRSSKTRKTVML